MCEKASQCVHCLSVKREVALRGVGDRTDSERAACFSEQFNTAESMEAEKVHGH